MVFRAMRGMLAAGVCAVLVLGCANLIANLGACGGNRVSVIDAAALTETGTITVGPGAVSVDASSDSTRVFVADAGNGSIAIVTTATGAVSMTSAPASQVPFMVRVFP